MAPRSLTGEDLVQRSIPNLLTTEYRTTSDSTQELYFTSTLGYWSLFERDARRHFSSIRWNDIVLDYSPDRRDNHSDHITNEQLLCGDEHSVVARFGQNIGHVMTSVIRSCRRRDMRFGDFKATAAGRTLTKIPDIAVTDSTGRLLLVGEAKTPWRHDIEDIAQDPDVFRNYLGKCYEGHI